MKPKVIALITMMLITGLSFAQQGKTINIKFVDSSNEGANVEMSLPLSFLEAVRPQIEDALGKLQSGELTDHDIDFTEIWRAVRDSGPTEFVEIQSADADVHVSTDPEYLMIRIKEKEEGQNIDVRLPLALGDALFEDAMSIDYDALVDALVAMEGQDLVQIKSETMNGRVWIE